MKNIQNNEQNYNIRLLAVKALSEINRQGAYANIVLQQYIGRYNLSDLDRRFFTELVYGVVRRKNYLDAVIVYLTKRPIKKLSSLVVEILRLGIYQIIYMDKVPDNAAVNESVKLAKKLTKGLSGFVNAVLRNTLRNLENLYVDALAKNELEAISYTYNQPLWLVKYWKKSIGKEAMLNLFQWFNEQPLLTARVNTLKISLNDCKEALKELGWEVKSNDYVKEALHIVKHVGKLEDCELVKNGSLTFMDVASMLVAHVVSPEPGDKILDTCAAPGGKTMHMAALMSNKGQIIAGDIHEHKLQLMEDNAKRLGVSIVKTRLQDASCLSDSYKAAFDKILVDAPCSGLGILQKKLDMRWRKEESLLQTLPELQGKILESAAQALKPGGILVYSTCTINPLENESVVYTFLKKHPEFTLDDVSDYIPLTSRDKMVTTNPAKDGMDGFFMARLRKEK